MNCPICAIELTWVDNGPRLQYHYCKDCKMELKDLEAEACLRESENPPDVWGDTYYDEDDSGHYYF